MKNNIEPYWNIFEVKSLQFNTDEFEQITVRKQLQQFVDAGHNSRNIVINNYFETSPMPAFVDEYVKPNFSELKNLVAAFNLFYPGQYLPLHSDLYGKYCKLNNISNIDVVCRIILMLEDSSPGQIIQIDNSVHGKWVAGDYFSWNGATKHAFYNFSNTPRYALQLTGTLQ